MNIKIHKLSGCEYLDYRQIKPLQNSKDDKVPLKDLSKENYNKLKKSLIKHGFTFPGFVWKKSDNEYYAVDMHQRLRVMNQENMNDGGNYQIPVVFIPAKDEKEAKEKLLLATSQYGTITYEGFDKFISEAEIPEAEIVESVHFDALFMLGEDPIVDEVEEEKTERSENNPSITIRFNQQDNLEAALAEIIDMDISGKYDAEIKVKGEE